jgi:drug/metabolite transporter (DMT)-like permease
VLIALALAVVYLAWGSTYLAIRIAINDIPPFLMLSARFLIAGVLLLAWWRWRRPEAPLPTARQWRTAALLGTAFFVAGNGGVAWAEQYVPTGTVALIVAVIPLFMVALDRIVWKAGFTFRIGLGMTVGMAGVVGIVGIPSAEFPIWAALVPVGGALAWAAGSLVSRRADLPGDLALSVGMQLLVGGVALLALGVSAGELGRLDPSAVSAASAAAVLYLAVVGSVITFSLYAWLLRVAPTPLVGTYAFVNPVVAVGLGGLVLGETMTPLMYLAAALTLSGVALIVTSSRRPNQRTQHRPILRLGPAAEPAAASNR